jgi:hypothetical protein
MSTHRRVLLQFHGIDHHSGKQRMQLKHYDPGKWHRRPLDNDMPAHDNMECGALISFQLMHSLFHTGEDLPNS